MIYFILITYLLIYGLNYTFDSSVRRQCHLWDDLQQLIICAVTWQVKPNSVPDIAKKSLNFRQSSNYY